VADGQVWSEVFKNFRPDIVIHLAAETATGKSLTEASKHAQTNVLGLTKLLDALTLNKIVPEHIILPSSRAVYGEGAWISSEGTVFYPGQRSNEQLARAQWDFAGTSTPSVAGETKEHPTSVYGATKLAQEHVLRSWAYSYGVPFSMLRLQNVYGPGQSPFNPYTGIVILFSRLARNKEKIELYEDGLVTRDFVYIDDVVEAIETTIINIPKAGYRLLDIGSGVTTTLIGLAKMITDLHSAPSAVISGKYRNGDVRHASCDIAAAAKELSWLPRWTLSNGITRLQSHLSENDLETIKI
jgi:dTDP-L-rhamnose 4-epimerase